MKRNELSLSSIIANTEWKQKRLSYIPSLVVIMNRLLKVRVLDLALLASLASFCNFRAVHFLTKPQDICLDSYYRNSFPLVQKERVFGIGYRYRWNRFGADAHAPPLPDYLPLPRRSSSLPPKKH